MKHRYNTYYGKYITYDDIKLTVYYYNTTLESNSQIVPYNGNYINSRYPTCLLMTRTHVLYTILRHDRGTRFQVYQLYELPDT